MALFKDYPDCSFFRNELSYNEKSGLLEWKSGSYGRRKRVGSNDPNRIYWEIGLQFEGKNSTYSLHRIVWVVVHGNIPKGMLVDHIDGNTHNNRVENLRLCNNGQNQHNSITPKNNTSGFKGVSWHKNKKKWIASVTMDWKTIHVGYFKTPEEAFKAAQEKRRELHGDFFRPCPKVGI